MKKISTRIMCVVLTIAILLVSLPLTVFAMSDSDKNNSILSSNLDIYENKDVIELTDLRTANTKQFRLDDGSYYLAQYDTDVHYLDEDGVWQDIDNTLSVSGNEITTDNAKIKFAKKITGNDNIFTIHNGNKKLTLSLNDAIKKTEGKITNVGSELTDDATELQKMTTLNKISASVIYEDILSGVDLEYVIHGSNVKENIIVKEKSNEYVYSFTLKLNNLTPTLYESGEIILRDTADNSIAYVIPAPIMWDASNTISSDVSVQLADNGNGKYTLTISADKNWINDSDRVFPIIIDPPIQANSDYPVIDLSVSTSSPNTTQSTQTYLSVSNTWRSYWKLSKLPTLPKGFYITDAQISMTRCSDYGNSGFVGVYDVLSDWDSTLTWNKVINTSSPQGNPTDDFADFEYINNNDTYSWNITEIVKKWYGGNNYGVMFAPASGKSITSTVQFRSNEYSLTASRPKLNIKYQIMRGIESYWSYTSQSAGFAGSGAVNNATGNLVFTIPTLTTTDALMPFTPTLVYNSSLATYDNTYSYVQTSYGTAFTPNGFKLNISETLLKKSYIKEDGTTAYLFVWSDGDGTEHYFMPTSTSGTYADEDGLHLTLKEYSTTCTITDDSDSYRYFSKQSSTPSSAISGWYLTSIIDKNGNKLSFGFDSSKRPTSVNLTPQGYSAIEQLRISYTSSGYPYAVWNPTSGEGVVFRYSSSSTGSASTSAYDYLRYVIRAHGGTSASQWSTFYNTNSNSSSGAITVDAVAEYTYSSNRLVTVKNNLSQYKVTYTYDSSGRITSVKEIAGADNTVGQQISLTYGTSSVVIQTSGQDDKFNIVDATTNKNDDLITTYSFDTCGRVVSCYTTDLNRTQIYGASSGQYVGDDNEKAKNNLKSSVQTMGQSSNYLLNGGFESTGSSSVPYWNTTGNVTLDPIMANSGLKCAQLTVNSSVNISTLYQQVKLDKGEYSLSMDINTDTTNDDISVYVKIESASNSSHNVNTEIPINEFYATGGYAFAGVNFSASPSSSGGKEQFKITVSVVGSPSSSVNVWVDNLMLSKTLGASEYDMTHMGHFETSAVSYTPNDFWSILDYPNQSITVVDSGIAAFGDVLKIVPDLETAEFVEQVVYSATDAMKDDYDYGDYYESNPMLFTVSGWGKGTAQSYAGTSLFGIEAIIKYYDGTTYGNTERYTFNFDKGITDWQFISGGFATNPDLGIVDTITVTIMYTDHAGIGYFDNISVIKDSSTTDFYNYNDAGYVTSYQNGSNTSWYGYDGNNNVTRIISSNKTIVDYEYDSYNNVTYEEHKHYTGRYNPSTGTFSGTVNSLYFTNYSYSFGLLTMEWTYDSTNAQGVCTYNAIYETTSGSHIFGVLLTETDSLDNVTRYFYDDETGRLLATIYPEGNGVSYTYDAVGNLTSVMPAQVSSNGSSYTQTTGSTSVTYGYDSATKRLSTITTKPSSSTSTTYSFTYDVFGNTTEVKVGDRILASYEYNNYNGKMTTLTYGNGLTVKYVYDTLDRISEIQYNTGSNGAFETVYKYTYDAAGNVYSIADLKNSEVTMYKYDAQGKLVSSYVYNDDTYLNLYGTTVYYDEQSRLSIVFHSFDYHTSSGTTYDLTYYSYSYNTSNGNIQQLRVSGDYISGTVKPVYDSLGRTTSKTIDFDVNNADAFYNKLTYDYVTYDDYFESGLVSRVTSEVRKSTSSSVISTTTYSYTYDANGNITLITNGSGVIQYKYAYDALGQLIREDNRDKGYSYVYTYDNAGNITSKKRYAFTTGTLGDVQQTYSYSYNDSTWSDLLTSYNGESITYDTIGNPLSIGYEEFTWEGRQLKTCFDGNYTTISYNYNADGILTYKEYYDSDSYETYTHYYTLSGSQIVKEDVSYIDWYGNEGEYTLVYIYDELGAPIGIKYRTPSYAANVYDCYFFEKNLQGDIIAIYNASGTKIVTYIYDAWGNVTTTLTSGITSGQRTVANNNPFRYRGYYYDIDIGMYYLQSRYYNPEWGRFLNADSCLYDSLLGYNLFTYCVNNPVAFIDPTGEWFGFDDVITGPVDEIIVIGGLSILSLFGVKWADDFIEATTDMLTDVYSDIQDLGDIKLEASDLSDKSSNYKSKKK